LHLLLDARANLLYVPATLMSSVLMGGLLGQQRFGELASVRVIATSSYLFAIVVVHFTIGAAPRTLAAAILVSVVLQIPLACIMLMKRQRIWRRGYSFPLQHGAWRTTAIGTKLHSARIVGLLASVEDRAL